MAIRVKSGGAGAPLGGAFVSGQGRRQVDDAKLGTSVLNQELNRKRRAATAYHSRVAQAAAQRSGQAARTRAATVAHGRGFETRADLQRIRGEESAAGDVQRGADFERRKELIGTTADVRARADVTKRAQRQEDLEIDQERRQEDVEFKISAKQRAEYNKLADAYDEAAASGEYTEEELANIRDQVRAKQAGIKPQARLKKVSKWPKGQESGDTWQAEDGALLTRDDKGNVKKLRDSTRPTQKDKNEAWKTALEMSKSDEGVVDIKKAREIQAAILGGEETEEAPGAEEAGVDPVDYEDILPPRAAVEGAIAGAGSEAEAPAGDAVKTSEAVTVKQADGKYTVVDRAAADELVAAGGKIIEDKKKGLRKTVPKKPGMRSEPVVEPSWQPPSPDAAARRDQAAFRSLSEEKRAVFVRGVAKRKGVSEDLVYKFLLRED